MGLREILRRQTQLPAEMSDATGAIRSDDQPVLSLEEQEKAARREYNAAHREFLIESNKAVAPPIIANLRYLAWKRLGNNERAARANPQQASERFEAAKLALENATLAAQRGAGSELNGVESHVMTDEPLEATKNKHDQESGSTNEHVVYSAGDDNLNDETSPTQPGFTGVSKKRQKRLRAKELNEYDNKQSQETEDDQRLPVAKILYGPEGASIVPLNKDELDQYVVERANQLVKNDAVFLADCHAMVDYIRIWPSVRMINGEIRGQGTKRLAPQTIAFPDRKLLLRSLAPHRTGPDLQTHHPNSNSIRVVYAIDNTRNGKIVVIEGIYSHKEFNTKFHPQFS